MARTIIVSNRLPIRITKNGNQLVYQPSEGGLATGLGSIYKEGENLWIGWPGMYVNKKEEKEEITKNLRKENMVPVFLSKKLIKDFYEGFSNETIWPTYHYFSQYAIYSHKNFEAYMKANLEFCNELLKVAEPDDTIWIHDYQLLVLPKMVRERLPEVSIGFFQHIPFPSYEVFRMLPWRKEILYGMLGADLIGFHTYDDMRHFLSSVSRLVGITNNRGRIERDKRVIEIDSFPMGIDYEKYSLSAASPETIEKEIRYRTSLGDQKLILSIDRLDYSKGIPQRLMAFEMFLQKYPEYQNKVSLILIVVPSRDSVDQYQELKEEVDLLVGRINGKYGKLNWTPIHYFYRSFPLEALSAFYRMAHVALVTPMRDGMNLVCKEYIASRLDQKGVLILSEMAGASKELSDAILINPNNINRIVTAIHDALIMPDDEQVKRISVMQETIKRYNIHHWVNIFMERLQLIIEEKNSLATRTLDKDSSDSLVKAYKSAKEKLIFLDYDGTLMSFSTNPKSVKPDKELMDILTKLSAKKGNRVVIISGRDKNTLNEWVGELPIDIIAEHGIWLREDNNHWHTIEALESEWKEELRSLLEVYVDRTPGSFIEEKDYSLVWHYRKVEQGLGELRTRELSSHLKYLSTNKNLQVLEGDMVVEIKSSAVNKGRAATKWLHDFPHDFTLAIGDDWTDEDTFRVMPDNAFTIKVGGTTSVAKYNLPGVKEVRTLLKKLI